MRQKAVWATPEGGLKTGCFLTLLTSPVSVIPSQQPMPLRVLNLVGSPQLLVKSTQPNHFFRRAPGPWAGPDRPSIYADIARVTCHDDVGIDY
jgi:hypothetical protein